MASPERILATPDAEESKSIPEAANDNSPLETPEELLLKTANDNEVQEIPPQTAEELESIQEIKEHLHMLSSEEPSGENVESTNVLESSESGAPTMESGSSENLDSQKPSPPVTASGGEGKQENATAKGSGGSGTTTILSSGGEKKRGFIARMLFGSLKLAWGAVMVVGGIIALTMAGVVKLSDRIITQATGAKGGGGGAKKPSGGGGGGHH